jgi:hypothetical protein
LLIGNYDTSKFEMRGVNYVEKHKVSNRTDLTEISSKPESHYTAAFASMTQVNEI